MQYQTPLSQAAYVDLVVRLISGFEGHEVRARDIGDGMATIGYGYTFNRTDNVALWTAAGISLSASERAALQAIDAASAANKTALTLSTFPRALTRDEAKALLAQTYPQYEAPANAFGMPLSPERAAFVSLTYNRGLRAAASMAPFAAALQSSNRAEAWFQIRYNALGSLDPQFVNGKAKRRYVEAQVFGLYDNPAVPPTTNDAKQILAMLTEHRTEILAYEAKYGAPPDGTNATRNMIAEANADSILSTIATVQRLIDALAPARNVFITWVNTLLPAGQTPLVAGDWNPAAIGYRSPTSTQPFLDARSLDGKGNGMNKNLLVGNDSADNIYGGTGDDVLIGQGGNDHLDGGAGSDLLVGGAGDDFLYTDGGNDTLDGGVGDDTYVIKVGAGQQPAHIVIRDADNKGTIILFQGEDILNTINFKKDSGGANLWTAVSEDGEGFVTIGHNSPWRMTLSDGTVIELGEGFDPTGFGMTLEDEPDPASNTFVGDFKKKTNPDGTQYLIGSDGNYVSDGAQPGAADLITGTSDADSIMGLAGDDALLGRAGDDDIDGGTGNDVLQGGLGADTLTGGEGNDIIYGSSNGSLYYPTDTNYTPPAPSYPVFLGQGFSWVMDSPGPDADGITNAYLSVSVARDEPSGDEGNVIDGGAGLDLICAGTGSDIVHGGDDGDDINGMAGNDVLYGDAGDDRIYGDGPSQYDVALVVYTAAADHGADVIDGGEGNDLLLGQGADDVLYGDVGDDTLYGDDRDNADTPADVHGVDYLDGGDGNDKLIGGGRADELFGGEGNDTMWGDAGAVPSTAVAYLQPQFQGDDYLDGEGGNDYLQGEGGDDSLFGGEGADTLVGDDVESRLAGSAQGADYLDGEDGDDRLAGYGGNDSLFGGAGNDQLEGDSPESDITGQYHGNDYLDGEDGNDTLFGQGGNDTLVGGVGNDYLDGDDVPAQVSVQFHGNDDLDGGEGDDTLVGEGGGDTLTGGDGRDQLQGGDGNDLLIGGAGADYLDGGAGDDTYIIAADEAGDAQYADTITDTTGADVIVFDGVNLDAMQVGRTSGGALILSWAVGQGIYVAGGLTSSIQGIATDTGQMSFDLLVGSRLTTAVTAASDHVGGGLLGGANNDQLTVTLADNHVHAGQGTDTINLNTGAGTTVAMTVGDGTDVVNAVVRDTPVAGQPAPQNVLQLDAGFDVADLQLFKVGAQSYVLSLNAQGDGVSFNAASDASGPIAAGAQPFDIVKASDGTTLSWQQILDRGISVLPSATAGNDVLALTPIGDVMNGLAGNDYIDGLAGNDVISGGDGNDTLIGGVGNDTLQANNGVDSLVGGDGNDSLYGGDANSYDVFEGGEGDDQYFFRQGYYNYVDGVATDASLTSNDTYHVRDSGQIGGGGYQTWNITDNGGGSDQLVFDSALVTPATTTVRSTGTGFALTTWNLTVNILNAVDANGNTGTGSVEAVVFKNGTTWTAAQLRAMSQLTTTGNDSVFGFGSDDVIDGGAGADTLNGGGGNDVLHGGAGYDYLYGGIGNDTLDAGTDGGQLIGDAGDDVYQVHAGDGSVKVGSSTRGYSGDQGFDVLQIAANPGDVTVSFVRGTPTDSMTVRWNDGSATATISLVGTQPGAPDTVDEIRFADGSSINVAQFVSATLTPPTGGSDTIELTSLDDFIAAGDGNDGVYGKGGNDTIYGDAGGDTLYDGSGDDLIDGGAGDDSLFLGGGNDTVIFGIGSGHDSLSIESGTPAVQNATVLLGPSIAPSDLHVKWSGAYFESQYDDLGNSSYMPQAVGNLVLALGSGADSVTTYVNKVSSTNAVLQTVRFQDGTTWSLQTLIAMANVVTTGNDFLVDAWGTDALQGGDGNDTLYGFNGDNTLEGGAGNDSLLGGNDADRLIGGAGDDGLTGGAGLNTIVYARGDGNDTSVTSDGGQTFIEFAAGITPADILMTHPSSSFVANVAGGGSITYTWATNPYQQPTQIRFADGTVWTQAQILAMAFGGTSGNDTILGLPSSDAISGGAGNDSLTGYTGSDTLDGGSGNDTLNAGYGSHSYETEELIGGAGDDVLSGGNGNNIYRFDRGFGHDTIGYSYGRDSASSSKVIFGSGIAVSEIVVSYGTNGGTVLSMPSTGDTIELSLAANDQIQFADGTTWSQADVNARLVYAATASSDLIVGTSGADTIDALSGNDSVSVFDGDDLVRGGSGNDTLNGDAGNDTLLGGIGDDLLIDSQGDDRYEYQSGEGQDQIVDYSGGNDVLALGAGITAAGTQVVFDPAGADSGTYRLSFGGAGGSVTIIGIESVVFQDGTVWNNVYIDGLARTINGTSGNDVLNGTSATDWIYALDGNDQLNGLAGNDRLDGGTGADTLKGGTGDDTYVVDNAGDVVTESSNQGYDSVLSSVSYTLPTNVESLELVGAAAINGTGNSLANTITGSDVANTLSGGTGADTMAGGLGDDTYVVDNVGDVVVEDPGEGIDLVKSSITYTLDADIENLTLTGSSPINGTGNALDNALIGTSGANTLTGGAGNDTLDGGTGNDTMLGGTGDDTYIVNVATDVVTELANEGIDTIQSGATLTLGANVENLTLTGSSTISGTGNGLDNLLKGNSANNTLTGGAGNDTLDGGSGNDTMVGGTGNDTFIVNVSTDVVTENAGEGTDTIQSAVTLTLGNNVENLTLTGSNAINGTGNALNNTLLGNSGVNVLTGAAGDDIYDGGAGNDTFTDSVTTSNDTYLWGIGSGLDTLTDAGGSLDHIDLYAGIAKSQLKFVKNANDLELSVLGQTDKLTIKNWYVGTANQIEEFRLSDGSKVLASEVNGLLSAMAAFVPMDSTISVAKTKFIDMPISNPQVPPQAWM